jgi:hypothetical protein
MKFDISLLVGLGLAFTSATLREGPATLFAKSAVGILTVKPFVSENFTPATLSPLPGLPAVDVEAVPRANHFSFLGLGKYADYSLSANTTDATDPNPLVYWDLYGLGWLVTAAPESSYPQFYSIAFPTLQETYVCWAPNYGHSNPGNGIHVEACDPKDPKYTIWAFIS